MPRVDRRRWPSSSATQGTTPSRRRSPPSSSGRRSPRSNLNELAGSTPGVGPFPHRSSAPVEALATSNNPHIKFLELDSNGSVLVDVNPERVRAVHHFVTAPLGDLANPIEDPAGTVAPATGGAWTVHDGTARVLPA